MKSKVKKKKYTQIKLSSKPVLRAAFKFGISDKNTMGEKQSFGEISSTKDGKQARIILSTQYLGFFNSPLDTAAALLALSLALFDTNAIQK